MCWGCVRNGGRVTKVCVREVSALWVFCVYRCVCVWCVVGVCMVCSGGVYGV